MAPVRHLLEALFNPYLILLGLYGASLAFLIVRGDSRGVRAGLLTGLLGLVILSTGFIPQAMTRHLENLYPPISTANPAIKWIVVLGGGQADDIDAPAHNLLYTASLRRLFEGLRLYHQIPHARLVLSGGGYHKDSSEAQHLSDLLSGFNMAPDSVVLESESTNTASQARQLKSLLQGRPFYLVTSAIHMPRAMALFHKQGLYPIAAPTDFTYYWQDERWGKRYIPNPNNLVYLNIAWHEVLGRLWASIRELFKIS